MSIALKRAISEIRFAAIHHDGGSSGIPANMLKLRTKLAGYELSHARRNYTTSKGELGYTYLLYSFAIAGDGSWLQTQPLKYKLWHATDWYKGPDSANQWGFGILLGGNFETDVPTAAQLESAAQIIYNFDVTNKTRLIVRGHQEFSLPRFGTLCPGANMGLSTEPGSRLSWIIRRVGELHGDPAPEPVSSAGIRGRVTPKQPRPR